MGLSNSISRLADLVEKAHSSLTGVGASDHHAKTTSVADLTDLFDATNPSTQAHDDAAVVGTASTASRRDHKHGMPASGAATKEFFVPVGTATTLVQWNYQRAAEINAAADSGFIGFFVPNDFTSIIAAVVVRGAEATATHRLNYYSRYQANGETQGTHSGSLLDVDTAETVNVLYEQNISSILSSLAANDYVGIQVVGDSVNIPNDQIIGIRFKYS